MIIPLIGARHILNESLTLPLMPLDIFQTRCTFNIKNGFTDSEMDDRIKNYVDSMEHIAHTDVYNLKIDRVEPVTNIVKSAFISMMSKSVSFTKGYSTMDEIMVGSTKVKHFSKVESGDVEIEFYNPRDNSLKDFLFNKEDGSAIQPKDGTCLLPLDYYFKIQVFQWVVIEGIRVPYDIFNGNFHVSSNLTISHSTESEEFQTASVTFSTVKVGGIIPDIGYPLGVL